jgi:mannosyltransferase
VTRVATDALARRRTLALPDARLLRIALTLAGLAALTALSAFLRTRSILSGYWIDEGLSVGIASFPLSEIPGALVQDGSPPLYYLLLHVWMDAFGTAEGATHALSLVIALAAVPAAFWAGWSLFGRQAGWIAAVLAAFNPFLTIYAQETRMYSLVILLGLVASAAFLHAFAFGRRRYLPVFALTLALLLYTHNWGLFFAAGTVAALALIAREARDRRALLRDAALTYGAVLLLYAPWLPTLVEQARHTGAPWSTTPSPFQLTGGFVVVLAGEGALVAILLAGLVGLKEVLAGDDARRRIAVLAALTLAFATLISAWVFSQISAAWATRYLAVLVGPTLLVAAAVLPRAGRLGLVALALVVVFWAPFTANGAKSNPRTISEIFDRRVDPGDVVLSTQPEQVPVLAHYFGPAPRYATPMGYVPDTRITDWRDALDRLRAAVPERNLDAIVAPMEPGAELIVVHPFFRDEAPWKAPWTSLVRDRSQDWLIALAADPRFTRTLAYVPPYTDRAYRLPLAVEIFRKEGAG